MAAILPPLALGGALIQGIGSLENGIATGRAAAYEAQVARNNAIIAQQNAAAAGAAGGVQAQATSLRSAATGGLIKAGQAASNIDVNSGSAVEVQASQRQLGELDAETAMHNAALQAYGYQTQATGYTAQAGLYGAEAEQAPIGGVLDATGNLLSNASNIGFKWIGSGGGS